MQTPKRTVKVRIGGKLTVRKRPAEVPLYGWSRPGQKELHVVKLPNYPHLEFIVLYR